ncbi:XdhC family protein [Candidatus Synechococcus calcipolaris G9]|uniref:XdhC family protein n=1 Tax=Candidatus Synechococcus calcipolaris G9 TaxID=1497997 RepID=A0ABT6F3E8_9SYNE|nr:XdhC/CoxI family protein [Candidatus Synechococcus calcipolaris]MDG2992396.1 XdhC family protein [Candidatus Synechococcus calcipolaris G9]
MTHFWQALATALAEGPVALATVVTSQGSTPRQGGARMLITPSGQWVGTIGGGAAEAKVIVAAAQVMQTGKAQVLDIDLWGNPQQLRDGICGGTMRLWVQYLDAQTFTLVSTIKHIHQQLSQGQAVPIVCQLHGEFPIALTAKDPFPSQEFFVEQLWPPPVLLVVGAGHVGRALSHLASGLGWQMIVYDDRPSWLAADALPEGTRCFPFLSHALDTFYAWQGPRWVALVTRGLPQDLHTLGELKDGFARLDYLGILGSRKRISTLRQVYDQHHGSPLPEEILHAPIGLEIGAETPEEIAVSIVAELIGHWRGHD